MMKVKMTMSGKKTAILTGLFLYIMLMAGPVNAAEQSATFTVR
jgi:hypothetical protein